MSSGAAEGVPRLKAHPVSTRPEMSKTEQRANMAAVLLPVIGVLAGTVMLWNQAVNIWDLVNFTLFYLITGFGITIGYHRLLTHNSFTTRKWLYYVLVGMGQMAIQGDCFSWAADHRKHHGFADRFGDPHSPHTEEGSVLKRLWHAQVGWLMKNHGRAEWETYIPDLLRRAGLKWMAKAFLPVFVPLSLLLPTLFGWLTIGGWQGALHGYVWGGLIRIFFQSHITWSINSVCHFRGRREFETEDESRNVFWLAPPSLGEAWHHNHHAFPGSPKHGLLPGQIDPSWGVIRGLERVGLAKASNRLPTPEKIAEKRLGPSPA